MNQDNSDSDSCIKWKEHSGRTKDGQQVVRGIGDTAHDEKGAVSERDAYDKDPYDDGHRPKDYDGDGKNGSEFWQSATDDRGGVIENVAMRGDSQKRQKQFGRMWYWDQGLEPSYYDSDDDGVIDTARPSNGSERYALRDKLGEVESLCDRLGAKSAVRSTARTLIAGANGRGHTLEKMALGAVLVADDCFLANRVARLNLDGPMAQATAALEGDPADGRVVRTLNVLEGFDDEALQGILSKRLKRREDVAELAEGFKLSDAQAVYFGDDE